MQRNLILLRLLQLTLDATDYLRNALNLTVFGTNYAFKKLREPVNKTDWISHGRPAVVNAYYSPLENSIRMFVVVPLTSFETNFCFFFLQNFLLVFYKVLSSVRNDLPISTTPPLVGLSGTKSRTVSMTR